MQQQHFTFNSRPEEKALEPPPDGPPPPPPDDPTDGDGSVSLREAARERYLNYALSVITSRALPDVRDGLKPVQRRILYAMFSNLRLVHTARFRKSAAVVGEVMARFHPHGDQSIYDAMVRQAQPFSLRYPLVEGHGNFGSLDGDRAAAMRYTEARLRALAEEMVEEIEQDTVPFQANYDGTTQEPIVLPSRLPQLLVNGCTGIAVGMATNIPPHNLKEVCQAAVSLIDNPDASLHDVMEHIDGPDFPMGGEILNSREDLEAIYRTGRGSVKSRATYHVEKANRRRHVVITSIPYGQNKATVVEQIGDLIRDNKVPQFTDVRDESTEDIRIVCELKRSVSDVVAMAYLYKHTGLQTNFHVNMTVLVPTENPSVCAPGQLGLVPILRHFLDFRLDVVTRRFRFELARLEKRIHILRGLAIVFDALDEAIAIIRKSDGRKDAAKRLMKRFPLDQIQTDAILDLKLYRLAKLEVEAVLEELATLEAEAKRIRKILKSKAALWEVVRTELLEIAHTHGDERRTLIGGPQEEVAYDPEKYIVKEDSWVIFTRGGWVKRQRGFTDITTIRVREGDSVSHAFRASSRSTVGFFSDRGRAYVVRVDSLPQTSGYGEPIQRFFNFADGEQVISVLSMDERNLPDYELEIAETLANEQVGEDSIPPGGDDNPNAEDEAETVRADKAALSAALAAAQGDGPQKSGPIAVAITRGGKGLLFALKNHLEPSTKNGRKFCSLGRSGGKGKKSKAMVDGVVGVTTLDGPERRICLASGQGRAIVFEAESLKLLRGSGKGVNAIRLQPTDEVIDFILASKSYHALEVETSRGRQARISERKYGVTRRGGKGYEVIRRGTLTALLREAVVQDPRKGEPEEGEEGEDDELLDELEDDGGDDAPVGDESED
ncbi:MAG: DNA topoisomerase [Deltaproteobacteria bacterium]|nr:DNA topoisomerase [Deltaproteobacteria bacterium]